MISNNDEVNKLDKEEESLMIKDIEDNLEDGIIISISKLADSLIEQLDGLSKKELKRVLTNYARYPDMVSISGSREIKATESLFMIKDLHTQMGIITIGRLQKEREEQENNNNQGEQK